MGIRIAARIERHPRRPADRRLRIGPAEKDAAAGQAVQVGGFKRRVTIARQVIGPKLVAHNEEDVADFSHTSMPFMPWFVRCPLCGGKNG